MDTNPLLDDAPDTGVRIRGPLYLAFAQACVNLNYFIDEQSRATLAAIQPDQWYPLDLYLHLLKVVANDYVDPAPILERVGGEIVRIWATMSADEHHVRRGIDFLHFQTSSEGYYSLVQGNAEQIGTFELREIDERAGRAVVYSTTPFPKDLERGILIGGLQAMGDTSYIDVDNTQDPNTFVIEFH